MVENASSGPLKGLRSLWSGRTKQLPVFRSRGVPDAETLSEEAELLAARFQFPEAIRLLGEANRRRRDPRFERRLLELRVQAQAAMETPSRSPEWPDEVEDLFPGETIPEIARRDLSVTVLHSAIRHHGSLLVRGLADPAQVDRLVGDIDRAFDAFDTREDTTPRPELAGWFEEFAHDRTSNRPLKREAGGVLAVDSPASLFDLTEMFEATGVARLIRDYFAEPPMLLAKKATLRRVRHDANTGDWHQDGAFMGAGIRSLNVWLSLTHCGDTAPGIDVVGRRLDDLVLSGTDGAHFAWSVGGPVAERAARGAIVRPIFEAGDALLFDQMNLHRTAVDPDMKIDRYAIETWFFAPSTYDAMTRPGGQQHQPRDQLPILF